MNKRTIIISYLLITLLTASQAVLAQSASGSSGDWAAVMSLQSGNELVVELKSGQRVEGKLSNASDAKLTIAR
ncbi:MAG TPA: hypothetical protein VKD65_14700, partial [Candidatus Angelobacter sp.]|nr:hypothetical protein [Candidatus Angelobacter sp.]